MGLAYKFTVTSLHVNHSGMILGWAKEVGCMQRFPAIRLSVTITMMVFMTLLYTHFIHGVYDNRNDGVLLSDAAGLRLHPGDHKRHHAGWCEVPMPGSFLTRKITQARGSMLWLCCDSQIIIKMHNVKKQHHQPDRQCRHAKVLVSWASPPSSLAKVGAAEGAPAIQSKTASVVVQVCQVVF